MTSTAAIPASRECKAHPARTFALTWMGFALVVGGAAWGARELEGWLRMIVVCLAMFFYLKVLTLGRAMVREPRISFLRGFAYLLLWPGMDARAFLAEERSSNAPELSEWIAGVAKVLFGIALVFGVQAEIESPVLLRAWVGMTGFVFVFHFGIFHLASCIFRALGIDTPTIMNRPIASRSLAEFWGARWNLAFRDLSKALVLRPASRFASPGVAGFVVFLFSGLIHEAAISYPASGGYGGPLAYFLIQWCGLVAEKSRRIAQLLQRIPAGNRWLAAAVILIPLPLLFHSAFAKEVILPLLDFVTQLV